MEREEMRAILEKHKKWTLGESGGERANLRYTDLSGIDLSGTDLRAADLSGANLIGADLSGAKLNWTKTQGLKGQRVIAVQVDTSRPNNIISYWVDLGVWTTGCFQGTLEELKEKIEETHKDNTFLRERYYRAIHFILQEADEDSRRIEGK
ncbi:pentapeptide repeat-containing protein [Aedoeadaptatus coxii]|uniref:pentapeptide repeat-containing protein n=1 Tax=Aedoeadaptatus coxii TaxID=755172 RepID=UPI002AD301A1|nr:pentapeptide repeat-containing protein [Peptoniphilus coxii]